MNALGLQMSDLIKPKLTLKAANTTGMEILGGVFVEVIISREGKTMSSRQLCYVTKGLDNFLLSRECCQSLGILSKKFPEVWYSSDKKEGGCSAGVGLASPASSTTMEVVIDVFRGTR